MELLDCTIIRMGHFHIHRNRRSHQLDAGRRLGRCWLSYPSLDPTYLSIIPHTLPTACCSCDCLDRRGFWTYEKNPIGLWFQSMLGTERNHFDRFGHFLQGFVPAIFFREIYSRCSPVRSGAWLNYFAIVTCLAFSALFELIEWTATVLAGAEGGEFLGHQGDVWDAQWDITWAIIGRMIEIKRSELVPTKQPIGCYCPFF